MTTTVTTVATIAFGPSFSASTTSSGRPPNPAWIAVASIIATTIAREIPASGATSPSWNQLAVRFGVVAESSTPHTHSISISRPLANQVYTPWITLSHAHPATSPTTSPNRSSGFGNGHISPDRLSAASQARTSATSPADETGASGASAGVGPRVECPAVDQPLARRRGRGRRPPFATPDVLRPNARAETAITDHTSTAGSMVDSFDQSSRHGHLDRPEICWADTGDAELELQRPTTAPTSCRRASARTRRW